MITDHYRRMVEGKWSGWRDSNSRHPAPKAGALPDCATPRKILNRTINKRCVNLSYYFKVASNVESNTCGAERGIHSYRVKRNSLHPTSFDYSTNTDYSDFVFCSKCE